MCLFIFPGMTPAAALVPSVLYLIGKFVIGSPPGHSQIGATTEIAALIKNLMLGISLSSNRPFFGAGNIVRPAVNCRHAMGMYGRKFVNNRAHTGIYCSY